MKQPTVAPKTHLIEKTHLSHILPVLGAEVHLRHRRRTTSAAINSSACGTRPSPKTINLEVGTIRAILRRHRLWANLQPDVRMLAVQRRSWQSAVAGRRKAAARWMRRQPVAIAAAGRPARPEHRHAVLGASTAALGADRPRTAGRCASARARPRREPAASIPLNDKATKVLKFWAEQFPDRKPEHFAFPSERYGAGGDDFEPTVFDVDPDEADRFVEGGVGIRQAEDRTLRSGSTTCATRASRACSRAASRCRSWPRFSAGVRRRRRGWRSGTGTSGRWRSGRRWRC